MSACATLTLTLLSLAMTLAETIISSSKNNKKQAARNATTIVARRFVNNYPLDKRDGTSGTRTMELRVYSSMICLLSSTQSHDHNNHNSRLQNVLNFKIYSNSCIYTCTMYNNLYNVTPIFYLICSMNIFFDSTTNFIICVISVVSEFFSSCSTTCITT